MARVSTHVLDSVAGGHAAGLRCQLFRLGEKRELVFDLETDDEGRFAESVVIGAENSGAEFELVLHAADYFAARGITPAATVKTVVLCFCMDDDKSRYHMPVMLAPHSYSTWWSD